ncbi:cysteine-rich CWC family protein [Paenibacillus sp. NPDC058071]|uniref:cysteine-rich CWC family protein n=1 Tax=Paenibacillus sp. NPDC058071 TaxID=3346326 RepID=UPI0036DA9A92
MKCPLCGEQNGCGMTSGEAPKQCWCVEERFPEWLIESVPQEQKGKSCICQSCLAKAQARIIE